MPFAILLGDPGRAPSLMTLPSLHSVATPPLCPTTCPMSLTLVAPPTPRLRTRPPLHSVAYSTPPTTLFPTAWPRSLISWARLDVKPGRPPRLMALPLLHSVATEGDWARAESLMLPIRQSPMKIKSPDALRSSIEIMSKHSLLPAQPMVEESHLVRCC